MSAVSFVETLSARPEVESVDLLHFSQTQMAAELLACVGRSFALDYSELLAVRRLHPLAAFARLRRQLEQWDCLGAYDSCIVWGSTDFASHMAPLLARSEGASFHGVHFGYDGRLAVNCSAARYLNEVAHNPELNLFSHSDLYAMTCGYPGAEAPAESTPTPASGRRIALHIRSSSHDKDWWPLDHGAWVELAHQLHDQCQAELVLLGSPSQREELEACVARMPAGVEIFTGDLRQSVELLGGCRGLVSVDTVSIHLAGLAACPSVVLRLGSSRGMAFVPGTHALCIEPASRRSGRYEPAEDESAELRVDDLVPCIVRHCLPELDTQTWPTELSSRLWIRAGARASRGPLTLADPEWPEYVEAGHDEPGRRWQALVHDALFLGDTGALHAALATDEVDATDTLLRAGLRRFFYLGENEQGVTAA